MRLPETGELNLYFFCAESLPWLVTHASSAINWTLTCEHVQFLHSAEVHIFVHELMAMQEYSLNITYCWCSVSILCLQQGQLPRLLPVEQLQQFMASLSGQYKHTH